MWGSCLSRLKAPVLSMSWNQARIDPGSHLTSLTSSSPSSLFALVTVLILWYKQLSATRSLAVRVSHLFHTANTHDTITCNGSLRSRQACPCGGQPWHPDDSCLARHSSQPFSSFHFRPSIATGLCPLRPLHFQELGHPPPGHHPGQSGCHSKGGDPEAHPDPS